MSLTSHYRELVRHSGIYAIGLLLQRFASLILLPVYTRYLAPEHYGAIALLDSLVAVLDIMVSRGVVLAMGRMHATAVDQRDQDAVWWTGLGLLTALASIFTGAALFARTTLADALLGPGLGNATGAVTLVLGTLWFNSIGSLLETHLRIRKWSTLVVSLALVRLAVNATFNVFLLIHLELGMFALLIGNLVTAAVMTAALSVLFVRHRGAFLIKWDTAKAILAYGSPLVLTTLLAFVMHQADRLLLRLFVPVSAIGIYSVAYQFGQGMNTLVLAPFSAIWGISKFEVAASHEAPGAFRRISDVFGTALLAVLFTASLLALPLLKLLTGPAYHEAASLVPLICLGYFFFSFSTFLTLPAELDGETFRMIPAALMAAVTNVLGNLVLIPRLGLTGAATATALTFGVLAAANFVFCRGKLLSLPLSRVALKLALVVGVVVIFGQSEGALDLDFWVRTGLSWIAVIAVLVASVAPRRLLTDLAGAPPQSANMGG